MFKDQPFVLTQTLVDRAKADGWFMHDVELYHKVPTTETFWHPNTCRSKYFLRYIGGESERMTHTHANALLRL